MPTSLRVASVVPLLTQTILAVMRSPFQMSVVSQTCLMANLGTVSREEFGPRQVNALSNQSRLATCHAVLARHVTAAQSVAEKQFTQPRDNAAGLNLF